MLVANIAITLFPIFVIWLFKTRDRTTALCVSVVVGYLVLPTQGGIDLPLLPNLDKHSIPILAALAMLLAASRRNPRLEPSTPDPLEQSLPGALPGALSFRLILGAFLIGAFLTVLQNSDALFYGPTVLPGMRIYDSFSTVLSATIMLLPFILGRKFLATPEAHLKLLTVIAFAAFAYSFLALYEVRMSPQINHMVYGYFPHSWLQHVRGGGFRPLVFLEHGLHLGIFLCLSILSIAVLIRLQPEKRALYGAMLIWMICTLLVSKNLGATAIMLMLLPVILLCQPRVQMVVAASVAVIVITYPLLRSAGLVPLDAVLDLARSISADRAWSLSFRLNNEDALLAKAAERPFFGWGGWGRNSVYDELGRSLSVFDGLWVIMIGQGGWFRYTGIFGLLTLPLIFMAIKARDYEISLASAALALILAGNLIDLIPNSGLSPISWMICGALVGRLELGRITPVEDVAADSDELPVREGRRYARDFGKTAVARTPRLKTRATPAKEKPEKTAPTKKPRPVYTRQAQLSRRHKRVPG